jgi:PKD repeat protein
VRGVGDYREGSYQWKFIDSDSNITYSTEPVPRVTFPEKGRVYASLVLDEGEATEANLNCSSISVVGRPILDCECLVELVSDTNNLSLVDEVQYKWTVAGCTTTAPPLLYYWPNGYEQSGIDSASVVRSFTKVGTYSPTVNVVNGDSTVARMACESASVINKAPANSIAPADSTDNLLDDITE